MNDKKTNDILNKSAIIILGATGDLSKRKLIPALIKLHEINIIDDSCIIVGVGRSDYNDNSFRKKLNLQNSLNSILYYHQDIKGLREYIHSKGAFERVIIFMALPPSAYVQSAKELHEEACSDAVRIIIEKPFGYNYESAKDLDTELMKYFNDSQIYRIDHYLGKEPVQNLLVFRFANFLFSQVWNNRYIESIQINAFEDVTVEDRGAYFDGAGIIRDMIQNHLVQLLCLLTMNAPASLDPEDIRIQKINILKCLEVVNCKRYQYEGYLNEKDISPDSKTETFADIELKINNFNWSGIPIYIRTGKALSRKGTEIGVTFKSVPEVLYNRNGKLDPNRIVFKIQPSEGIVVDLTSKVPGNDVQVNNTHMSFCYKESFNSEIPEAYQKLLFDALQGDKTLFVSAEETELSWKIFDKVLDKGQVTTYKKGEIPEPNFCEEWIDFDSYRTICSI